jgi:hypothetical protein
MPKTFVHFEQQFFWQFKKNDVPLNFLKKSFKNIFDNNLLVVSSSGATP